MKISICPYCDLNTVGEHEWNCPLATTNMDSPAVKKTKLMQENTVCDSVIEAINREVGVDENFKKAISPFKFNAKSHKEKLTDLQCPYPQFSPECRAFHRAESEQYVRIQKLEKENERLDADREKLWKHNASLQKKIDDLEKQLKFKNLPLNERIEKEWIAKRENEEKLTNKKESE